MSRAANDQIRRALRRAAEALNATPQDVMNGRRQGARIFARKEAFRRVHSAIRPRHE